MQVYIPLLTVALRGLYGVEPWLETFKSLRRSSTLDRPESITMRGTTRKKRTLLLAYAWFIMTGIFAHIPILVWQVRMEAFWKIILTCDALNHRAQHSEKALNLFWSSLDICHQPVIPVWWKLVPHHSLGMWRSLVQSVYEYDFSPAERKWLVIQGLHGPFAIIGILWVGNSSKCWTRRGISTHWLGDTRSFSNMVIHNLHARMWTETLEETSSSDSPACMVCASSSKFDSVGNGSTNLEALELCEVLNSTVKQSRAEMIV